MPVLHSEEMTDHTELPDSHGLPEMLPEISEESMMGSSPPSMSISSRCSSVSSDGSLLGRSLSDRSCSDRDRSVFSPKEYLKMHRSALDERARLGAEKSTKMKGLYRCVSLESLTPRILVLSFPLQVAAQSCTS